MKQLSLILLFLLSTMPATNFSMWNDLSNQNDKNDKPESLQPFMKSNYDEPSYEYCFGHIAASCGACAATTYCIQTLFPNAIILPCALGLCAMTAVARISKKTYQARHKKTKKKKKIE